MSSQSLVEKALRNMIELLVSDAANLIVKALDESDENVSREEVIKNTLTSLLSHMPAKPAQKRSTGFEIDGETVMCAHEGKDNKKCKHKAKEENKVGNKYYCGVHYKSHSKKMNADEASKPKTTKSQKSVTKEEFDKYANGKSLDLDD